jgi:hypothetical protein
VAFWPLYGVVRIRMSLDKRQEAWLWETPQESVATLRHTVRELHCTALRCCTAAEGTTRTALSPAYQEQ